jgi:hypothetical protein
MSSARILRPFARAIQRPVARPTSYAAFSTKSDKLVAPFTPSVNSQLMHARTQQSTGKAVEPAEKMSKLVRDTIHSRPSSQLTGIHRPSSKTPCRSSSPSTLSTRQRSPLSSSRRSSTSSPSTCSPRECALWPLGCSSASYNRVS